MSVHKAEFLAAVELSIGNKELRQKISAAAKKKHHATREVTKQFAQLETARQRAAFIRWKAIDNLDKYLVEFEANFTKRGGKVIWANNSHEASEEILKIVNRYRNGGVVKSKSMLTEEIGLNEALLKNNHEVTETDSGQFILQLAKETPSHMVMPVLHKSSVDVMQLFNSSEILKDHINAAVETVEDIVAITRRFLREKYQNASVGITGANFIIADAGAIVIAENEGNGVLASAMPKVHIAVAGIDTVIPSINDLDLLLPLLSSFGTGQPLSVYNTIISGPFKDSNDKIFSEMYVVIVDNGRSKVMEDEIQRQAMYCIYCGACMLSDPVYRIIGGHAYNNLYNGPYGSVILPHKEEMKEYIHLSEAYPLDGQSAGACPVKIDFNKLFLHSRKAAVDKQLSPKSEKWFYFFWKKSMLKRKIMKMKGIKTHSYFVNALFSKSEKGLRSMPEPAAKSFNEMWQEKLKS